MKIKNVEEFQKVLATGVKQITSGKNNIWVASCFAIQHYNDHGDHGCLNDVLNALGKGKAEVGQKAFASWVELYTDQMYSKQDKKLIRVKRDDGVVANVEEAIKNCFWDKVAKDQSITHFDADDFYKKIIKVVKFHSDETKSKGDEHAIEAVLKMKNFVQNTAPNLTIN